MFNMIKSNQDIFFIKKSLMKYLLMRDSIFCMCLQPGLNLECFLFYLEELPLHVLKVSSSYFQYKQLAPVT